MTKIKTFFAAALISLCTVNFVYGQNYGNPNAFPSASNSAGETVVAADESVPVLLEGVWENRTRYVLFDSGYVSRITGERIPSIALKTFYGWYGDRAAESDEYTQTHPLDRNDSVSQHPQIIQIHFEPLTWELFPATSGETSITEKGYVLTAGEEASGAWDMMIKYPGDKNTYHVPIAVIGNKLYLNFKIRNDFSVEELERNYSANSESLLLGGFWKDECSASGIMISPAVMNKELLSYYITDEKLYHIRYWQTDMEYEETTQAAFSDSGSTYYVPKHLVSSGKTFTCVNGRGRNIRNIERTELNSENYIFNSVNVTYGNETFTTATILVTGEPYLTLVEGSFTYEDLLREMSLRVRPAPAPLFPPHGILDFDWSIIEDPPASYDRRMLDLGK